MFGYRSDFVLFKWMVVLLKFLLPLALCVLFYDLGFDRGVRNHRLELSATDLQTCVKP